MPDRKFKKAPELLAYLLSLPPELVNEADLLFEDYVGGGVGNGEGDFEFRDVGVEIIDSGPVPKAIVFKNGDNIPADKK